MSRIAAKKCLTLSCVSASNRNKPNHCLTCGIQRCNTLFICTEQKRTPGTLSPVTAHDFFQEYIKLYLILVSPGLCTFTLFTMTHIFYVHCGEILIARSHKVKDDFTGKSQWFFWSGSNTENWKYCCILQFVLVAVVNRRAFILPQKCQSH